MKKLTFPLSFENLYLLAILMVSAVSKFAKLTDSINWKDYLVLKVFKKQLNYKQNFFYEKPPPILHLPKALYLGYSNDRESYGLSTKSLIKRC